MVKIRIFPDLILPFFGSTSGVGGPSRQVRGLRWAFGAVRRDRLTDGPPRRDHARLIGPQGYFGRVRRDVYLAVIAAWTAFVIAGYLIPIGWTGFRGVTLWQWINLLVIPVALAITMALTSMRIRPAAALRGLRPYQKGIMAALVAGWVVTLAGGYALGWKWTGYTDPANDSLWAWLQMLLVPLLLPTVLQPALLKWITGDAADRASTAAGRSQSRRRSTARSMASARDVTPSFW